MSFKHNPLYGSAVFLQCVPEKGEQNLYIKNPHNLDTIIKNQKWPKLARTSKGSLFSFYEKMV